MSWKGRFHDEDCLPDGRVWNDFGYSFNIIYLASKSKNIYLPCRDEPVKRGDWQQRIPCTEVGVDLYQSGLCKFSQRTKNARDLHVNEALKKGSSRLYGSATCNCEYRRRRTKADA
jgi:hypothetical protein